MGYRRDNEDRLLARIEQKEGDLRRKDNWFPKGRKIHLKYQIEELRAVLDQEETPHPRRENFIRSGQARYTFDFNTYKYGYVPL